MTKVKIIAVFIIFLWGLVSCNKPDTVRNPESPQTATNAVTVEATGEDRYYQVLIRHFGRKKYTGPERQYTPADVTAPLDIIEALNGLKLNYLHLLRGEILARNGFEFQTETMQRIFMKQKWYIPHSSFNETSPLGDWEDKNNRYLQKLLEIDKTGGTNARQLAEVLNYPKEKINTYEALKVYLTTGEIDVLTTLSAETIKNRDEGITLEDQWNKIAAEEPSRVFKLEVGQMRIQKEIDQLKFILAFAVGQRMAVDVGEGQVALVECIMMTNSEILVDLVEGGVSILYLTLGLAGINSNNEIQLSKMKVDLNESYTPTMEWENKEQNNYAPLFGIGANIWIRGKTILPFFFDGLWYGESAKYKRYKNTLYALLYIDFDSIKYKRKYRYYEQEYGFRGLYQEMAEYANKHGSYKGAKIFKITVIDTAGR